MLTWFACQILRPGQAPDTQIDIADEFDERQSFNDRDEN